MIRTVNRLSNVLMKSSFIIEPCVFSTPFLIEVSISWFLIAFGSLGCRGSAGRLAPFVPQVRTLSAGSTNFLWVLGHVPQ